MQSEKQHLRQQVLNQVKSFPPELKEKQNAEVADQLKKLLAPDEVVGVFLPLPTEPDISPLIEWLWSEGKKVLAPKVVNDSLVFFPIKSWQDVTDLQLGVRVPSGDQNISPVSPAQFRTLLVPAVAFDSGGYRLGRGGGYYDRLIAQLPSSVRTIGVCFSVQKITHIPKAAHDQAVQLVVSGEESG